MPSAPSPGCVLLIDDSHEDLFLIKRLLSRTGVKHPIVSIDGGEEAIVYLRACLNAGAEELRPAAIFCDVKMPRHNGFDVLKWLQRHAVLRPIPFFVLSGADLDEDRARALELGATGYVVKFPSGEQLKKLLAQARML